MSSNLSKYMRIDRQFEEGKKMKKLRKLLPIIISLMLVLAGSLIVTSLWGTDVTPLAGITVKDQRPNGCVDCHRKVDDEKDYRLPVGLSKIKNHPPIEKVVKTVPNDCMLCHKENTKAGPLNLITHKDHYQQPEKNNFVSVYKGDCLNCHSLDMTTFKMGIKSAPANW